MDLNSSLKLNFDEEEDQPPRLKTKLRFIIYFVVVVGTLTSAFTIWKSHQQNPSTTIQIVCSKTYDFHLCFKSLSSLLQNTSISSKAITPSDIFTLSLHFSINELNDQIIPYITKTLINETERWSIRNLKRCNNRLNDSQRILNTTLTIMKAANPHEKNFRDTNFTIYLEKKLTDARDNIASCSEELFYRPENDVLQMMLEETWLYTDNSLRILYCREEIQEELNPTIGSLWNSLFVSGILQEPNCYVFLVVLFSRA